MPGRSWCAALDTKVSEDASCGLYLHGEPSDDQVSIASATAEEAGLVDRQVRCENCKYLADSECALFNTLNRTLPNVFDLDVAVDEKGCCNAQTPLEADIQKDSPTIGDVHVTTALGNEKPKRRARDFKALIGQGVKVVDPEEVTAKHYGSVKELPKPVKRKLKGKDRRQWMHVFNSSLGRHGDESRAFAEAWFVSQKSAVLSGQPMVGVGGRKLEPFDGDTFLVPFSYDPMALAYMRPDQVPRVLDAITHPDRLPLALVNISELTAVKSRVGRDVVQKHLDKMGKEKGRISPLTADDHVEGRDDLNPITAVWMNSTLYMLDGHDRTAAVWLDGGDMVYARFGNVDNFSDDKPDDNDTHRGSAFDLLRGVDGRTLLDFKDDTLAVPFLYDAGFFAKLRPDQVPKFIFAITHGDELQDSSVPLDSVVAIQNRVNADTVAAKVEKPSKKLPVIVRLHGVNYIGDGHDRLAAKWLSGGNRAAVKLTDITYPDNGMKPDDVVKKLLVDIQKSDPDKQQIFGWASVCTKNGEHVIDKQGDIIPVEALEPAVYEYVLSSRDGSDMHVTRGLSRCIESMMFSKQKQEALGIDLGMEGWWVGYQVDHPPLWAAIKRGERPEFSIGGAAVSKEI